MLSASRDRMRDWLRAWPVTQDRLGMIAPHVRAGRVLDIGCVDSRPTREQSQSRVERKANLLFRELVKINPSTLGVDIDAEGVAMLRRDGYRAVHVDAETMQLGERFDTIVAGEVIEHLENPGRFLRNLASHLHADGTLILTTPNPFSSSRWGSILRRGYPRVHEDHTCWFDPMTLMQLLERAGFETVGGCWLRRRGSLFRVWPQFLRRYLAKAFLVQARPATGAIAA